MERHYRYLKLTVEEGDPRSSPSWAARSVHGPKGPSRADIDRAFAAARAAQMAKDAAATLLLMSSGDAPTTTVPSP